MEMANRHHVGAWPLAHGRCEFRVWAPTQPMMAVHLLGTTERVIPMQPEDRGYHTAIVDEVPVGTRYQYRFPDGHERPDPASRAQPEGVHGPSQVVAAFNQWTDDGWRNPPLREYVIYELHVGTFTAAGTFDAIMPHLPRLRQLGITAVEIMPIAQFPGVRNWGYDGACLFAVQPTYGGPTGFARLVDACHAHGLAVILDVVYNHLGPEGNYLGEYGPYYTPKYRTPWGNAINFDDAHSDGVRDFFIQNALHWVRDGHVDALRLDAVHAISDLSAYPFLAELANEVHTQSAEAGRPAYLIAESDLNDARLIDAPERNGLGLDAQWSDDFHHALHTLLTQEQQHYYADFGHIDQLVRSLRDGYAYSGDYSCVRQRRHGNDARNLPAERFIFCTQNHDQVGNRTGGERLSQLVDPARLRLAAGALLLAPALPLIFMGEEYGETHPFLFFINYEDQALVEAVRAGWQAEHLPADWQGAIFDPQDSAAFEQSKLDHTLATAGWHAGLQALYAELIALRRTQPALAHLDRAATEVQGFADAHLVTLRRWHNNQEVLTLLHFGAEPLRWDLPFGDWQILLDSSDPRWAGPEANTGDVRHQSPMLTDHGHAQLRLAPWSFICLQRTRRGTRSRVAADHPARPARG